MNVMTREQFKQSPKSPQKKPGRQPLKQSQSAITASLEIKLASIQQITDSYISKTESYIWKRLKMCIMQRVVEECRGKNITAKEKVEDYVYEKLKCLNQWLQGRGTVGAQRSQEAERLRKQLKSALKVSRENQQRVNRRDQKIRRTQKTIQQFMNKINLYQNNKQAVVHMNNLKRQRQKTKRIKLLLVEEYPKLIQQLRKDYERQLYLNINQLLKPVLQGKEQMQSQIQKYRNKCNLYFSICQEKDSQNMNLQRQISQYKIKNQQLMSINAKLLTDLQQHMKAHAEIIKKANSQYERHNTGNSRQAGNKQQLIHLLQLCMKTNKQLQNKLIKYSNYNQELEKQQIHKQQQLIYCKQYIHELQQKIKAYQTFQHKNAILIPSKSIQKQKQLSKRNVERSNSSLVQQTKREMQVIRNGFMNKRNEYEMLQLRYSALQLMLTHRQASINSQLVSKDNTIKELKQRIIQIQLKHKQDITQLSNKYKVQINQLSHSYNIKCEEYNERKGIYQQYMSQYQLMINKYFQLQQQYKFICQKNQQLQRRQKQGQIQYQLQRRDQNTKIQELNTIYKKIQQQTIVYIEQIKELKQKNIQLQADLERKNESINKLNIQKEIVDGNYQKIQQIDIGQQNKCDNANIEVQNTYLEQTIDGTYKNVSKYDKNNQSTQININSSIISKKNPNIQLINEYATILDHTTVHDNPIQLIISSGTISLFIQPKLQKKMEELQNPYSKVFMDVGMQTTVAEQDLGYGQAKFQVQDMHVEKDEDSCSSSESQYVYETDTGTQCELPYTNYALSYSLSLQLDKLPDYKYMQIQQQPHNFDNINNHVLQNHSKSLESSITIQIATQTDPAIQEEQIHRLNSQIASLRYSEEMNYKELENVRLLYRGALLELDDLKHRLINSMDQKLICQPEQTQQKESDEKVIELLEQKIQQLSISNAQLKKHNEQLLQTIEYANSLFNCTSLQKQQARHMSSIIKQQIYIPNIKANNHTESTQSIHHEYSQKSQQQFGLNINNYSNSINFNNSNRVTNITENNRYQPNVIISKYNCDQLDDFGQDEQRQQIYDDEEDQVNSQSNIATHTHRQKFKISQIQMKETSYGAAVARLLAQFVNNQNKQQNKMAAFATLVQMLKPSSEVTSILEKYKRQRRMKRGLSGLANQSSIRQEKQFRDGIKDKLYRFLTQS